VSSKEPVLLAVLIETIPLRWYVAGIGLDGGTIPLMRSEAGNLGAYLGASLDEQVSFLRHRLAGVLQRGCDRLWGRNQKPCQIVFLADGGFDQAPPELTHQVAEHFVAWMVSPPVVFFVCADGFAAVQEPVLQKVAGDIAPSYRQALEQGLPQLWGELTHGDLWELSSPGPRGVR
jgi:hypothetical protein